MDEMKIIVFSAFGRYQARHLVSGYIQNECDKDDWFLHMGIGNKIVLVKSYEAEKHYMGNILENIGR